MNIQAERVTLALANGADMCKCYHPCQCVDVILLGTLELQTRIYGATRGNVCLEGEVETERMSTVIDCCARIRLAYPVSGLALVRAEMNAWVGCLDMSE